MELSENINAILILEIMGTPAEHLVETLEEIIKKISETKGVKLIKKTIHEPKEIKEKKNFYHTFTEIEIQAEEPIILVNLIFNYMPAHIEIITPEKIKITNQDFNDIFNELARKLHGYEEVARVIDMEKKVLENKLRQILNEKQEKKD